MNLFAPMRTWLRRRLRADERGFTLVELMVAQGIILVSLLSLAYTATIGFSDIALARQRQFANGLLNRTVEQVRSLPFDVIKRGLSDSDSTIAEDITAERILTSGCGAGNSLCYQSTGSAPLEAIPHGNNASLEPLNPHRAGVVIEGATYTRWVYITYYNNDETLNAYRLTVVVRWTPPQRRGVEEQVQAQTILYSPPGCTSTATHPFAAPCQPFLYASADRPQGSFVLTGSIQGVSFTSASLFTTSQSATMQIEQISSVQTRALSSGVKFVTPTLTQEFIAVQGSASADNDPSQPGQEHHTASLGPTTTTCCVPEEGAQNFLDVTASTGDAGVAVSTVRANTTNQCQSQIDDLPCGRSTSHQGGAQSVNIHLQRGGAADLGLTDVAEIAPSSAATGFSEASVDRTLTAGVDGSVSARMVRRVAALRLGALPSNFPRPGNWDRTRSLVRIVGYADQSVAAAGTGSVASSAPSTATSAAITSGTLDYWNPATGTYTTVDMTTIPESGLAPAIPDFSFTGQVGNQTVRVEYSEISLRFGGRSSSETVSGGTRRLSQASVAPPVVGSFRQRITLQGTEVLNVVFTIDLVTASASAQYVPAPGG